MKDLIFATHNDNKVKEVRALQKQTGWHIISLNEAGLYKEIPEPHDTLEANAREKSQDTYRLTGKSCFSEDTGLEVSALNGSPGVHSARYAGPQKLAKDNIVLLLENLQGKTQRKARFRTVISLILEGEIYQFEGICQGIILEEPQGTSGFGYDPVFRPDGAEKTFAQMDLQEKNKYSHRAKAFAQLWPFLEKRAQSPKK